MKLRIRDNSLRLRLTQVEVERLRRDGLVSARILFPDGRELVYEVESSPASVAPTTFYVGNTITVRLPETLVLAWAATDQVSIEEEQLLTGGERLRILVEKDFACLAPREGEDESDMYPHPMRGAAEQNP